MRALAFGIAAAIVLAGPKLHGLVQDGSLSGGAALARGAIVAAGCAVAFAVVASIAQGYRAQAEGSGDPGGPDSSGGADGAPGQAGD